MSTAPIFRRLLRLLAVVAMAGSPAVALAQLPPPNIVLTEPRPALLTVKSFDVHLRAASAFVYDDNISLYENPQATGGIQTGRNQPPLGDDFIYTFAPGIRVAKATTLETSPSALSVDYTPSFIFFMKNDEENSLDHAARLTAGYGFTKLTLGLSQDYISTAGGVIDVGNRVSQENYNTAATARYELTEKTFLQSDGTFRIIDYETLTDSTEWYLITTMNYQISPKVTLGFGVTVGQLYVSEQSQIVTTNLTSTNTFTATTVRPQTYAGPTLRASYRTTEKTDISLTLGAEYRTYDDGSSEFGPVFALTGSYRPFEGTGFTLEAHRRVQNSAVISGANYISTGASLSVRQRFRDRLFGSLTASYDNADYVPTSRSAQTTRNDDYFLLRPGLEAILGRSWTVGIFYQYRQDISSEKIYSFVNNQVGIQAAWGY